jgi:predicted kinase
MTLIVMAGLPGTGKTTLAQALLQKLTRDVRDGSFGQPIPPTILNKDVIRAALFPPELIEYSMEQDDFCLEMMLHVARYLFHIAPQRTLILDGRTFSKRYQVQTVEQAAVEIGAQTYWIECVCDPATAKRRLMNDILQGTHPANNRVPDLYDKVKAGAEPFAVPHVTIETTQPIRKCVAQVMAVLSVGSGDESTG